MPNYEIFLLTIAVPLGMAWGGVTISWWRWQCRKLGQADDLLAAAKTVGRIYAVVALFFLALCLLDVSQRRNPYMELNLALNFAAAYWGSRLVRQSRKA